MADKNEAMENLFKAIDIITQERLTNLGYDKTIKATITDDSNADKGEYTVSDGSSDFIAYSNVKYSVDTIVYVIIPQGDYDNTKLIVGKYTDENSTYNYVSPSDDFLDITHNLITNVSEDAALLANDPDDKFCIVWKADGLNYQGYNRLALKGNFRTWLSSLDVINGTYGLMLYIVSKEISYSGNDFERTYKFNLSSEDMYGNPFNFETYYLQEKVFDISNIPDIISMELIFYQNCDFMTADGILADYQENKENHLKNLFVQAPPYVSLGYDIDDVVEDEVKLYTLDATTYDATYEELTRQKTLNLRWIHVRDDGSIIAIDQEDEIPENAEIRWYKYQLDRAVCDKVAGTFWSEITEARNKFSYTFSPDIVAASEKYKVIIECPSRASVYQSLKKVIDNVGDAELNDENKLVVKDPDTGKIMLESQVVNLAARSYLDNSLKSFQEYKQIIEEYNTSWQIKHNTTTVNYPNYGKVISALDNISREQANVRLYRSEIVEFTNESYDPVSAAIDLISGLEILVDAAGYNGSYLIYNESGMITNAAEATRKRVLTASYTSLITGEESLDKAESIIWYLPLEDTMIYPPQRETEYNDYDYYEVLDNDAIKDLGLPCGYCRIERAIPEMTEGDPGSEMARQVEQCFRIKDYYTQTAVNNTIYCTVFKNNQEYKASATLTFGTSGTNGTEATFKLELREVDEVNGTLKPSDRPASALTIGDTVAVVPRIYNYDNEDITKDYLVTQKKNHLVSFSWYGKNYDPDKGVILTTPSETADEIPFALLSTSSGVSIDKCQYYILMASVYWAVVIYEYEDNGIPKVDDNGNPIVKEINGNTASRDVQLTTFLPIPVRISNDYTQAVGPTQIIYNSNGTNPTYYKMPFKLYKNGKVTEANWQLACLEYEKARKQNSTSDAARNILKFYPALDEKGNLTPTNMYLADDNPFAVEAVCDREIVWTQPILIIKNKYSSAMLNSWDGDFVVNEENGTIMGTMFGAGKKDENNTFSGVLMGDVEIGAGIPHENKTGIGLYGFNQSEQSFGFNVDGTAFIGKAGRGRITMDGNNGVIQSGSYSKNDKGMRIDLDGSDSYSASLFAYGPGGSFELNTNKQSPLLVIRSDPGDENSKLFYIGNNKNEDFYLQSWNYNGKNKGTRLNLKTGEYSTYADNGSYVKISPKGSPYFQIYDYDKDGQRNIFYASESDFYLQSANYVKASKGMYLDLRHGTIDARSGIIGGWTITATTLEASGIKLDSKGSITAGNWTIKQDGTGQIGPFSVSKTALAYSSNGANFEISTGGLNLNGNFKVDLSGNLSTSGNVTIAGHLNVSGSNNKISLSDGNSSISCSNGGSIGGKSWNYNEEKGHFGVWYFDKDKLWTDAGSTLGAAGTMTLTNAKAKLVFSDDGTFLVGTDNYKYTINGTDLSLKTPASELKIGHAYMKYDTQGCDLYIGTATGFYVTLNGTKAVEVNNYKGIRLSDGSTTFAMTKSSLKIDDLPMANCDKVTTYTFKTGLFSSKSFQVYKGFIVSIEDTDDVDGGEAGAKLGKLAYLDEVVVSKANFSLGTVENSTVSGNTATYKVKIPGQSYSAGSSGSVWVYAYQNSTTGDVYISTDTTPKKGYRRVDSERITAGSSGSGTTPSRTLTVDIVVKAQSS